ncbi:hypothetical protein FJT64_004466 [Amphibalanus amphitrite]|uniref:Integrase zinc-binding domain-containing protein n=1 Tax=Amphibalanus amphitrite TaxID=1232801 RepID=A0A6A4VTT5_AMPAM|nr:hypothetical protein FJT64_004466 [Amphibalanus amphitrite]
MTTSARRRAEARPDVGPTDLLRSRDVTWVTQRGIGSDHLPILVTLSSSVQRPRREGRGRFSHRSADWPKFREERDQLINAWSVQPTSLNEAANRLAATILRAARASIPFGNGRGRRPPFWNQACQDATDRREEARVAASRSRSRADVLRYQEERAAADNVVDNEKTAFFRQKAAELKPDGDMWHLIRIMDGRRPPAKPAVAISRPGTEGQPAQPTRPAVTDKEKAELFCQAYAQVSRLPKDKTSDHSIKIEARRATSQTCCNGGRDAFCSPISRRELLLGIRKLRKGRSPGWRQHGDDVAVIDLKKAFLQLHVAQELWPFQTVIVDGQRHCLTRVGFGLSVASGIMRAVVREVLDQSPEIAKAVLPYADDLLVNETLISAERVAEHFSAYGLSCKPPERVADEAGARMLGLRLELELLEEEEYDHQSSAVDRQALARPAAAAPSEPAAQLREPLLPGDRSSRTRDWVEQSSQYGQLAHLTGPAKESVRGMLCDSSLYGEALRELEEEFGDPARVIHATMKKLLDSRPVKDGDMSAVTELSRDLRTAVRVLQCLHYDADISAATNVTAVISKLPAALALKWGEHAVHSGLVRPTLADLDSWLRRYVAAGRASLTLTGHQQSKAEVNTWARRFAHNSRSRAAADRRTGPLTAEELREAERVWLLSTQAEQFGDEIEALQHGRRLPSNSQMYRLNPFLDPNGLLRVGGQLRHAQLDFKVKHRVILPARGDITRLIVTDRHKKLAHSGAEHVLARLRHHFWVISDRAAVKRYTPACMPCRKRAWGGHLEHICVLTGPNAPGRPPPAGSAVCDTTTTATRLRRRNGAGVVRFD